MENRDETRRNETEPSQANSGVGCDRDPVQNQRTNPDLAIW